MVDEILGHRREAHGGLIKGDENGSGAYSELGGLVDLGGFEPPTFRMRTGRSPAEPQAHIVSAGSIPSPAA